ncbi:DUF6081 family protein [Candidatus Protochlamydia phocaeensis]|uniref:DUF6081 family protein n=1 Tax=Candidatus Protochlamydia phocaeensis TaxID=1414722 RepID=UPI000839465A|nr:DUF6081 family protein [Candidatus Protochlamydia phocaeensis]
MTSKYFHSFFMQLAGAFLFTSLSASTELVDSELKNSPITEAACQGIQNELNETLDSMDLETLLRQRRNRCEQLVFKANLSQCRIGLNDRSLLGVTADFVTSFNGNDFSCSVLPVEGPLGLSGIQITPANGLFYTLTIPPIGTPGPVPDGSPFDHIKFLAYSYLIDAPTDGSELCSEWVGSGLQTNVENNPFGLAVTNPNEDCRLSTIGFVSLAPDVLTTFDWMVTNDVIYALVERLPGAESTFGLYAAYTYTIPVGKRHGKDRLNDLHRFQTCYNRLAGTVTWKLDGRPVFQITQIGHRLTEENAFLYTRSGRKIPLTNPDRFKILDHGGFDQSLSPVAIQSGLALFTLLDAYRPNNVLDLLSQGLVRLGSNEYRAGLTPFYSNPQAIGLPATFTIDAPLDVATSQYLPTIPSQYRLWGQGGILRLFDYRITINHCPRD